MYKHCMFVDTVSVGVNLEKELYAEKGDKMAKKIVLSCVQCGHRNYTVPASKKVQSIRTRTKKVLFALQ